MSTKPEAVELFSLKLSPTGDPHHPSAEPEELLVCLEQPARSGGSQKAITAVMYAETLMNPENRELKGNWTFSCIFHLPLVLGKSSWLATGFPVLGCHWWDFSNHAGGGGGGGKCWDKTKTILRSRRSKISLDQNLFYHMPQNSPLNSSWVRLSQIKPILFQGVCRFGAVWVEFSHLWCERVKQYNELKPNKALSLQNFAMKFLLILLLILEGRE